MSTVKAIFLGIVQGLTEFLPVSSSGHLLMLEKFGVGEVSVFFNIMLHLGTLFSVIVVFYKQIFQLVKHPIKSDLRYIIIATIPTGIIAIIAKLYFKDLLLGSYLPLCFMFTATMLIASNLFYTNKTSTLSIKNSILTGVMQGVAVLPGISRSGITISTLMLLGTDKTKACEFSFMLSIPIILASVVSELPIKVNLDVELIPLVAGVASSFFSGVVSLSFLYKVVKNKSFVGFSVYLILLSFLLLFINN